LQQLSEESSVMRSMPAIYIENKRHTSGINS
jgi:hypothetical protein